MIGFFRIMRGNLLQENKFTRYALYAIGEIFLVVVGILIAFQVNSWNEARKARAYEAVILKEIRENVNSNIEGTHAFLWRAQTSEAGIQLLLAEMAKPKPDHERMKRFFSTMTTGVMFTYNRSAFDSLKASGLDRLSNEDLRKHLIRHFDTALPRTDAFMSDEYDRQREVVAFATEVLFTPVRERAITGEYQVNFQLKDGIETSSPEMLRTVASITSINNTYERRLRSALRLMESIQAALDSEITGVEVKRASDPVKSKALPKSPL